MDYSGYLRLQQRLMERGFEEKVESFWCDRVSSRGPVSRMEKGFAGFSLEYDARWVREPLKEELMKPTGMREMAVAAVFVSLAGEAHSLLLSAFSERAHRVADGKYRAELVFDDDAAKLASLGMTLRDAIALLGASETAGKARSLNEALSAFDSAGRGLPATNRYAAPVSAAVEAALSAYRMELAGLIASVRDDGTLSRAMEAVPAGRPFWAHL